MKTEIKLDNYYKISGSKRNKCSKRSEGMNILDFSKKLNATANETDLKKCIHDIIVDLGFTDFSIVNMNAISMCQLQLETMPAKMVESYYDKRLYTDDITVTRAVKNSDAFFASELYKWIDSAPIENDLTENMTAIDELYKSYEYHDSYHIPFEIDNDQLLLTITSRAMAAADFNQLINERRDTLNLLVDAVECALSSHFSKLLATMAKAQ
jgi:Autoinducer binding domain